MKVVFLDTVHPILQQRLEANGFNCVDCATKSKALCLKEVNNAHGIVIRSRFQMDADFLKSAPELEFIARSGAGMENIDVAFCEARNITLFNAPEGNRNAVAEHALGMLLALFNNLLRADREVRSGKWDREGNRGIELDGKTVGIIGYGNNGEAFAKKLSGFEVNILAYDKYKTGFGNEFVKEASMEEIYGESDVLSLHIPQNDETIFMVNDEYIQSFHKPIYVINLARGKIVQTSSLVQALKNEKILGACLDVLEYEKSSFESFYDQDLPDDFQFLLSSEKVMLSPHVGGWTEESYFKLSDVLADKILNFYSKG